MLQPRRKHARSSASPDNKKERAGRIIGSGRKQGCRPKTGTRNRSSREDAMQTNRICDPPARGALIGSLLGLAATTLVALLPAAAQAAFPDRPIRIIVPFAPGGGSDLIARVLSGPLQQELGQPVIVENHAGANGNIGIGLVAKADPDGYTLLVASSVIFVNLPLQRPSSFDPASDFTPIADLGGSPDAIVTRVESNIKDFPDLMKRAKENPRHLTFSSSGVGSISQLG